MLHHTFDQDPVDPLRFVWSEVYKNDKALLAHLANPALAAYLDAHAGLCDGALTVEIYGTVGDKVIEAINETGVPYKIFKTTIENSNIKVISSLMIIWHTQWIRKSIVDDWLFFSLYLFLQI